MVNHRDFNLRPLEQNDLPQILAWRNTSRIREAMFSETVITWEQHQAWYKSIQINQTVMYQVFEKNSQPLGLVYFTGIDRQKQQCDWGFYLGETGLPHGTGMVMGVLGLENAFAELQMEQINGMVLDSNVVSQKFHRKMGFAEIKVLPNHVRKNGIWHDVILFSLSREDWESHKSKLCTEN